MVWAERFEPVPNDADAVAYRLWKDQKDRQNCQRRERNRKRQEKEAAAAAARVVPQRVASVVPPRVARVVSPVEAAAESEEEATLSELEAQLEAQPAEAQPSEEEMGGPPEDKEETVLMSHMEFVGLCPAAEKRKWFPRVSSHADEGTVSYGNVSILTQLQRQLEVIQSQVQ